MADTKNRKFQNVEVEQLVDLYLTHPEEGNLLLIGPPGTGKTMCLREKAREYNMKYIVVCGRESMQDIDMLGAFVPTETLGQFRWVDGPLSKAFQLAAEGQKVLFVADEINRMPTNHQNIFIEAINIYDRDNYVLFNPMLGKHLVAPRKNLVFAATANINQTGLYSIPQALIDRFNIVYVSYPDPQIEKKLVIQEFGKKWQLFGKVVFNFVQQQRKFVQENPNLEPISTRSLVRLGKLFVFHANHRQIDNPEEGKKLLWDLLKSEIIKSLGFSYSLESEETYSLIAGLKSSFEEFYKREIEKIATKKGTKLQNVGKGVNPLVI